MTRHTFQNLPGKALLQHLHHGRGRPLLRFTDEQMEVLRHYHIADDDKPIAAAHLLEQLQKDCDVVLFPGSDGGDNNSR